MTIAIGEATAQLLETNPLFGLGEETIRGVRTKVWLACPPSLRFILELSRGYGAATYLVYEDERLTYEEHFVAVARLANALRSDYGVEKGDRVAIAMRNLPEWVIAFWAIAAVGGVAVPLNAWWTGHELAYGLEDSGTTVAFVDPERLERLRSHSPDLSIGDVRRVILARGADAVAAGDLPASLSLFEPLISAPEHPEETASKPTLPTVSIDADDDATIFYTSGTTGFPKGAVGTQRNICSNLMSLGFTVARSALQATGQQQAILTGAGAQNCHLLSVPLFHATGCHASLVAGSAAGTKIVMMRRWNPERALELIERERINSFGGVPTMAWQVINSPDFARRDTSSVRTVAYGGAPAPPELVRRVKEHFPGGHPSNGYGLTETSAVSTMNSGPDYLRKPESVGPPVPVCEIKVTDEEGRELARGETGELWIKGPNVVRGYWNKPEDTAATFQDGWLRTGDVAWVDDESFVFIVDRAKDMVIRGGENVYSAEVEAAIFEHPSIADTAIVGVPHEVLGEEVAAVVVLAPGAELSAEALRDHLTERVAGFKVPAHIWFRDEPLPRNAAGKVLKRELRTEILDHIAPPQ